MRALGLLGLLIGVVVLATPTVRDALPFSLDIEDSNLRIIGGCLIALGAAIVWLNRD